MSWIKHHHGMDVVTSEQETWFNMLVVSPCSTGTGMCLPEQRETNPEILSGQILKLGATGSVKVATQLEQQWSWIKWAAGVKRYLRDFLVLHYVQTALIGFYHFPPWNLHRKKNRMTTFCMTQNYLFWNLKQLFFKHNACKFSPCSSFLYDLDWCLVSSKMKDG